MSLELRGWLSCFFVACVSLATPVGAASPAAGEGNGDQLGDVFDWLESEAGFEAVVATTSIRPTTLARAPGVVSVVSRREIDAIGARSLVDILRVLPGLDVSLFNDGTWRPSIRGLDQSADLLLLINGERVNDPRTGRAVFTLPAAIIEKIEVIRGPGSALFGSNAFIGVISITTREAAGNVVQASYGLHGSEGAIALGGDWGTTRYHWVGDISYSLGSGLTIESDRLMGAQPDVSQAPGEVDGCYLRAVSALTLDGESIDVGGMIRYEDRGAYIGPLNILVRGSSYRSVFADLWVEGRLSLSESILLVSRMSAGMWDREDHVLHKPQGWRSGGVDEDIDGDGYPEVFPDGLERREAYTAPSLGWWGRAIYDGGDFGEVTLGVEARYEAVSASSFMANAEGDLFRPEFADHSNLIFPESNRTVLASYLEWKLDLGDWFSAVFGGRYDMYSDFGAEISPRGALVVEPWSGGAVKLLAGSAFRAPTLEELHSPDSSKLGNEDLQAETITTYELVFLQRLGEQLEARVSGYSLWVENRIDVPQSTSTEGKNPYRNFSGTRGMGFDLELRVGWENGSWISVNGAYHRTYDEETADKVEASGSTTPSGSQWLERVAPWSGNLLGNYVVGGGLELGGVLRFRSARKPDELTTLQRLALKGHDESAAWMIDLTARYDKLITDGWVELVVYNVLGTAYGEVPPTKNEYLDQGEHGPENLPVEPRSFRVSVGLKF